MRWALVACVAAAGCGDNASACGALELLDANRNIWVGHIAVDDERVYYSDYDNGFGTHLVFRQPKDGGQALVIAARDEFARFGFGMAVDASYLYWTAEAEPVGYTLWATPVLGGRTFDLTGVSGCTAHGIAVDSINAYAGAVRCNNGTSDVHSRVMAVPHNGTGPFEIWSSADADVSEIAAVDGTVFIATTAGLVRIDAFGTRDLLDGRPSYHVEINGDELLYSTQEDIRALPLAGGAPRTLFTFRTSITNPRPFASDGGDLYVAEPPELVFVPAGGGAPMSIVHDMGAAITHIVARGGSAYWTTLALPGSLGIPGTFSGGVLRVRRPCQ